MTISELIERLEALKAEHGDLPVRAFGPGAQTAMEIDEDDVFPGLADRYILVSGF